MLAHLDSHRFALALLILGLIAIIGGDWTTLNTDYAAEMQRLLQGMLWPDLFATEFLLNALGTTITIAVLGIALGAALGAAMVPLYRFALVRVGCTAVRAVHEIFWALLFLQVFGLSTVTALLALALPYAATFARVFSDILSQAPRSVARALPLDTPRLLALLYAKVLPVWPQLVSYTRYRFECALRASAVLGFVGLPTLGFHLETAFRQGYYAQGGALLWLFFALIGTQKWWLRGWSWPLLALLGLVWLPWQVHFEPAWAKRFLLDEIWPQLQYTDHSLWLWLEQIWAQAGPGIWGTLMVAFMALLLSALLCSISWPIATRRLFPRSVWLGRAALLVGRSMPELLLAFILLMIFGPSMLPAALALAIHNGSLIAHLLAQRADDLPLRRDTGTDPSSWAYEYVPRLAPGMRDLLTYRFEIMVRETAMLGMLGVASLGFYVDSAFELFQFDVAFALIVITALINILIAGLCTRLFSQRD
ncbi:ABC transporter permease [Ferrimonas pelagia]|uniref:ABC transporter permease n=1 Tax=Ferrimonas pelagia TaxID=1177826 RepID=A0ABP9F9I4_9GAMM